MSFSRRLARARVLQALEARVKQFRSREALVMFRVPHEPIPLDAVIEEALGGTGAFPDAAALRTRTILRFEWHDGSSWDAWAVSLPSGIAVYCDTDAEESRVLASVRRGSQNEADRFFVELLAESHGEHFGIATSGDAPDRVRTGIADRDFLADVFADLFEGTPAGRAIHRGASDFRSDVAAWLDSVLVAPLAPRGRRRVKRLREERE